MCPDSSSPTRWPKSFLWIEDIIYMHAEVLSNSLAWSHRFCDTLPTIKVGFIQRSPPSSICMDIFTDPVPVQQKYNLFSSAFQVTCRQKRVVLLLSRYRDCKNVHTNGRRRGSLYTCCLNGRPGRLAPTDCMFALSKDEVWPAMSLQSVYHYMGDHAPAPSY